MEVARSKSQRVSAKEPPGECHMHSRLSELSILAVTQTVGMMHQVRDIRGRVKTQKYKRRMQNKKGGKDSICTTQREE